MDKATFAADEVLPREGEAALESAFCTNAEKTASIEDRFYCTVDHLELGQDQNVMRAV